MSAVQTTAAQYAGCIETIVIAHAAVALFAADLILACLVNTIQYNTSG
jgi:hypothetical protein